MRSSESDEKNLKKQTKEKKRDIDLSAQKVKRDAALTRLVGGTYYAFSKQDYWLVIPSYLLVSQSIHYLLSHTQLLDIENSDTKGDKMVDFFFQWYSKYESSIGKLAKASLPHYSHDIKQQLTAINSLSKVLASFKEPNTHSTTSLLSKILSFSNQNGWIQSKILGQKTVYFFSATMSLINPLSRDLAMECFSALLVCMTNPKKLKTEILQLLIDEGYRKSSPTSSVHISSSDAVTTEPIKEYPITIPRSFMKSHGAPTPPSVVDVDQACQPFGYNQTQVAMSI
ncbi:MAG: hypothetical protein CL816_01135 [Coxiellaceae bacterium]|nr:hypothetical protein [Coxiellaceae bacterium]|tara:strand:- start:3543 stop:4394 length:852 start_codon:yes stop_codon:yes gene_type:complete